MEDLIVRAALESAPMTQVERGVVTASVGRKISSYTSTELAAELQKIVKWVALDVGVRLADGELTYTVVRMCEILNRHYGWLTVREVRNAFELVLTGDLDEFLPKREGQPDRSAYGAFNMTYVCKVLNAYRAMRGAALKRYRANLPVEEKEPSAEEEQKAAQEIRKRINDCYRKFVADEPFETTLIDERLFYDLLAERGLVEKFDQPVARDINGSLTNKGKDAPYARERRAAIMKCFEELKKQGATEI